MPSSSPIDKTATAPGAGRLYVVGTPLGNLADITLRALEVLRTVDLIAAEDTRHTRRMLSHHRIRKPLVSYHEHNEERRSGELLTRMINGEDIALVSDAGTPGISDPGYRLVTEAVRGGIQVVPVPGGSALTTALSAAGMPTDAFVFAGFAPKKKGKRRALLERMAACPFTVIFYESPRRLPALLADVLETMGDRDCVVAREMTKLHEEFLRGLISEVLSELARRREIKGECTLLVAGRTGPAEVAWEEVENRIKSGLEAGNKPPRALAKEISDRCGVSSNRVYKEIIWRKGRGKV